MKDAVVVEAELARQDVVRQMTTAGSLKQQVLDADKTEMGTVSISSRRWVAVITDPAALLDWVIRNRPDEIVPMIRESYLEALKAQVVRNAKDPDGPGPYAVDPATGERLPGVEAHLVPGNLTIRKTSEAKTRARALLGDLLGRALGR